MGTTKTKHFSESINFKAKVFKALGHPARIAIIELLIQKDSCICNEMVDELPLSQSTISQHLKELKDAGIIKGTVVGPKVCYCIDSDVWTKIHEVSNTLFNAYYSKKDCC